MILIKKLEKVRMDEIKLEELKKFEKLVRKKCKARVELSILSLINLRNKTF